MEGIHVVGVGVATQEGIVDAFVVVVGIAVDGGKGCSGEGVSDPTVPTSHSLGSSSGGYEETSWRVQVHVELEPPTLLAEHQCHRIGRHAPAVDDLEMLGYHMGRTDPDVVERDDDDDPSWSCYRCYSVADTTHVLLVHVTAFDDVDMTPRHLPFAAPVAFWHLPCISGVQRPWAPCTHPCGG